MERFFRLEAYNNMEMRMSSKYVRWFVGKVTLSILSSNVVFNIAHADKNVH